YNTCAYIERLTEVSGLTERNATPTENETENITTESSDNAEVETEAAAAETSDVAQPSDADSDANPTGEPHSAEELIAALAASRAEVEKHKDAFQRERAEFMNFKKRTQREQADAHRGAVVEVIKAVLPIIDDFERAVANIPDDQLETPFVEGTVAIERKLKRLLEQYDIEAIDPVGEAFNPDEHQALGVDEDSDVESGHVSQTLQKGYRKEDKLLRPALVRVAG
ncbi:MAG: nucleotide exchange factor GrpE, partial [Chloroflexota bacterium]